MSLVRWEPFSELDSLQKEMNRLFSNITPRATGGLASDFVPAAEMSETADEIERLKAALMRIEVETSDEYAREIAREELNKGEEK